MNWLHCILTHGNRAIWESPSSQFSSVAERDRSLMDFNRVDVHYFYFECIYWQKACTDETCLFWDSRALNDGLLLPWIFQTASLYMYLCRYCISCHSLSCCHPVILSVFRQVTWWLWHCAKQLIFCIITVLVMPAFVLYQLMMQIFLYTVFLVVFFLCFSMF